MYQSSILFYFYPPTTILFCIPPCLRAASSNRDARLRVFAISATGCDGNPSSPYDYLLFNGHGYLLVVCSIQLLPQPLRHWSWALELGAPSYESPHHFCTHEEGKEENVQTCSHLFCHPWPPLGLQSPSRLWIYQIPLLISQCCRIVPSNKLRCLACGTSGGQPWPCTISRKAKKRGEVKRGGPIDRKERKKRKYKCLGLYYPHWQRVYIRGGEICSMCQM